MQRNVTQEQSTARSPWRRVHSPIRIDIIKMDLYGYD